MASEKGLEAHRARFTDMRAGLAFQVDQGMDLIEELLKELDATRTTLNDTKFDLENECEARRRLQQEAQDSREWKERQGRRPFVVALIDADADCYVFHEKYLNKGEMGGEEAADALHLELRRYVQEATGVPNDIDIFVKAFANVSGLGAALVRDGRLKDAGQLRSFAAGFSSRKAFFEIIDVGPGKERADTKIRDVIKFFVESSQCQHLVLACGHDTGYAPFLGQLVGDKEVAGRITLLEGSPLPQAIRKLGFQSTRFSSVFTEHAQLPKTQSTAGSAWGRGAPPVMGGNHVDRGKAIEQPGIIRQRPPALPNISVTSMGFYNKEVQSHKLGPVLKDNLGRRFDRPLQADKSIMERLRMGTLCYHLYLRGECVVPTCQRNHMHRPLSNEEFDALWGLSRQSRCFKSQKAEKIGRGECLDATCIYGHGH